MSVADLEKPHPRGVRAGCDEIGSALRRFDSLWVQGGAYHCSHEDLSNLTKAMNALKALLWFAASVRDIRAFRPFRVEQWSDFRSFIKE